jgi:formiminotetrahydrofolate cyclodeaminase
MNYKNDTLEKYVDDLAAKLPAPGGGSAAALTASLGIALISMVINFTLGKPKYAKYEAELKRMLEKSEQLRQTFLDLVDLDVAAYKSKNIREALDVPLMVCRLCFEGMKLCPGLIRKSNLNLISDVGVAAILLESAYTSAKLNVEINLKAIADEKLTKIVKKELTSKGNSIQRIRTETEVKVGEIIRR